MNDLPNIAQLIAHDAPMILIDELVHAEEDKVHCRVIIHASGIFFNAQTRAVPGYIGMEFMAQTVAIWAGYHAWKRNETPAIGFLLGGRSYRSEQPHFPEGMVLDIHAKQILKSDNMAAFSCTIHHKGILQATCELNVYEPPAET